MFWTTVKGRYASLIVNTATAQFTQKSKYNYLFWKLIYSEKSGVEKEIQMLRKTEHKYKKLLQEIENC